jgi:predicted RNA-binding Zn ribbon-like protein
MSVSPSLDELQRNGFPMGGEPLVALDLADTVMTAVDPEQDLLSSAERSAVWWAIEQIRLPEAPVPDPAAIRRLRTAIRGLLDAHLEGRTPEPTAFEDVNAVAASVPTSLRLVRGESGELHAQTRWHTEHGGNAALAAIAGEAIDLLSSPAQLSRLRRCANPTCSMLFLAETKRRQWCTPNICGNRARVARHYQRTHSADAQEQD